MIKKHRSKQLEVNDTEEDEIKALERHVFKELNKGKAAAMAMIDEVYAADMVYHGSAGARDGSDMDFKDFKTHTSALYDAAPDFRVTLDDMFVEGDKVAVRLTFTGTLKGAFMGIPPTNKKITWWAIEIHRLANGKIVEFWSRTDTLSLMQQLGVIPMPKK